MRGFRIIGGGGLNLGPRRGGLRFLGGGGLSLPYTVDFSALSDGALPSQLTGATWAISSGKAINTPTLLTEALSNVEYTTNTTGWGAANSATLTRRDYATSPNIAPTGGLDNFGLEVANGGASNAGASQTATVVADRWYRVSTRSYAPSANTTANAGQLVVSNNTPIGGGNVSTVEDAWESLLYACRFTTTSTLLILRCTGSTAGDLMHYDAPTLKQITPLTTFAFLPVTQANVIVRAAYIITSGLPAGVIARCDSSTNPLNYLIAYHVGNRVMLDKVINGAYASLINSANTKVSGANVEIRCSGTTVQLWYNGTQIGTDQTVSDVEIVSNKIHGMFSVGVSQATSFFAGAP